MKGIQEVNVRLSQLVSGLALGAALTLSATSARAQHHGGGEEYPLSYVERPLTLPKFVLAPEGVLFIDNGAFTGLGVGAGIELGASFGITNDFEVNATVAPIRFAPRGAGAYGEPILGATYRFLRGSVEVGGRLQVTFLHEAYAGALLIPSVPILAHIGKVARLDLDPGLIITAAGACAGGGCTGGGAGFGVQVPVRFALDITEPFHIGANSGIVIRNFANHQAESTFAIPLGIFAGYAVGQKKPIVDIDGFFGWDKFATPADPTDRVRASEIRAGVAVKGYIYL
jgi:hypothetical protein